MIEFSVFWTAYPRKVGRKIAERKWKSLTAEERDRALHGLGLWKHSTQWAGSDWEFIPYASTFLNQERYNDEPWNGAFEEYPFPIRKREGQAALFAVRSVS